MLVFSLMKNPGAAAPMLAERMVKDTAKKVIRLTEPIGNQFVANLLGVLIMKMFPKAVRALPMRTYVELPSSISNLSHIPPITKIPPKMKHLCMPNRFRSQLQGKANKG